MPRRSLFRDFLTVLRKRWRVEMPLVPPIDAPLGPSLPKASTYYAGMAPALGLHVFINFQHSPTAWEVGRFTVNLILSKTEGEPDGYGGPFAPGHWETFTAGSYRIGWLVGGMDKWWHLKDDKPTLVTEEWRPTSYDDPDSVFAEAVDDVTRDVRLALARIGVSETGKDGASSILQPG
jgi:hypothetical protein